jgi:hypothetical protein
VGVAPLPPQDQRIGAIEIAAPQVDKSVELRIPGHDRSAWLTVGGPHQSVIGAIEHEGGFYEPRIMGAIADILEPDSISLDIGANIGALSIAMAWATPTGSCTPSRPRGPTTATCV